VQTATEKRFILLWNSVPVVIWLRKSRKNSSFGSSHTFVCCHTLFRLFFPIIRQNFSNFPFNVQALLPRRIHLEDICAGVSPSFLALLLSCHLRYRHHFGSNCSNNFNFANLKLFACLPDF
jgi:hypothetical protein